MKLFNHDIIEIDASNTPTTDGVFLNNTTNALEVWNGGTLYTSISNTLDDELKEAWLDWMLSEPEALGWQVWTQIADGIKAQTTTGTTTPMLETSMDWLKTERVAS